MLHLHSVTCNTCVMSHLCCRTEIMDICSRLGIQNFVPRSYIEQVQMMQLTQDFAEITDKARQHFTTGDDSIIDDHVIGASPARRLMFNSLPHRHSTDDSLLRAAMAQKPQRSIAGWTAPAPPAADPGTASSSPRNVPSMVPQRTAPSQLSLEINASAAASQADPETVRSRMNSGNLPDRTSIAKGPNSAARTCVASPKPAMASSRTATRRQNSLDSVSQKPSWVKDPDFWVPNKTISGVDSAELAVLQNLNRSLDAAVTELHVIAGRASNNSQLFTSAAAGFAVGAALTLIMLHR